jgi:hypothetical protein
MRTCATPLALPFQALQQRGAEGEQLGGVLEESAGSRRVNTLLLLWRPANAILQHLLALQASQWWTEAAAPTAAMRGLGGWGSQALSNNVHTLDLGAMFHCCTKTAPRLHSPTAPPPATLYFKTHLDCDDRLFVAAIEAHAQHHAAAAQLPACAIKEEVLLLMGGAIARLQRRRQRGVGCGICQAQLDLHLHHGCRCWWWCCCCWCYCCQ